MSLYEVAREITTRLSRMFLETRRGNDRCTEGMKIPE
jgi:hypothetical protein